MSPPEWRPEIESEPATPRRWWRTTVGQMSHPLASGWEIKFRLAALERSGEAYQELFASIMERRDAGFQRVRPWGNQGDRKNDGWSPGQRTLFQSYAPRTMTAAKLLAKLQEDYDGAKDYWQEFFDTWVFVHNDPDGLGPEAAFLIESLNAEADFHCTAWGVNELREQFSLLHDSDKSAILGPELTAADFLSVDAEILRPLLENLGMMIPDPTATVEPVPVTKLNANDLSTDQIEFLRVGSIRAPIVDNYMNNAYLLPSHKDAIAEAVRLRYVQLRDNEQFSSQRIFDELLAWVCGGVSETSVMSNALAILAFFFERCDIFENPAYEP